MAVSMFSRRFQDISIWMARREVFTNELLEHGFSLALPIVTFSSSENGRRRPKPECRWPLEAKKDKETDSPLISKGGICFSNF